MRDIKNNQILNILYIHANNYDVGGADYCLLKLASGLESNRYNPTVILRKKTHIYDLYINAGIKVKILPIVRLQKTRNIFKLLSMFLQSLVTIGLLVFQILQKKIDIVHTNDLLDFSGNIAARLTGRKSIQHIRMIVFENMLIRRAVSKFLIGLDDKILCVSMGVLDWYFSPENKKAVVLYDWLDMEKVGHKQGGTNLKKELNLPENALVLGSVGRLEWWKGQHILLEAAKKVLDKNSIVHFVLIGGTVKGKEQYKEELILSIKKLMLSSRVHLLGERKDILNVIDQFDIAIHCSVKPDPFPGVVLEAMACGKPVVGARAGGVPEQIDENVTGLLFEPGNPDELEKKIIYLLDNKNIVKKMGEAAQSQVHSKFDKKEIIGQLESIYKALVK